MNDISFILATIFIGMASFSIRSEATAWFAIAGLICIDEYIVAIKTKK